MLRRTVQIGLIAFLLGTLFGNEGLGILLAVAAMMAYMAAVVLAGVSRA